MAVTGVSEFLQGSFSVDTRRRVTELRHTRTNDICYLFVQSADRYLLSTCLTAETALNSYLDLVCVQAVA